MIVYHITRKSFLRSIMRYGLRCLFSQGRLAVVWMASARKREWALRHVGLERGLKLSEICCIRISVPRAWLRRHRNGIYTTTKDIPSSRILGVDIPAWVSLRKV